MCESEHYLSISGEIKINGMPGLPHRIGLLGATGSTHVREKRISYVSGRSKMFDLAAGGIELHHAETTQTLDRTVFSLGAARCPERGELALLLGTKHGDIRPMTAGEIGKGAGEDDGICFPRRVLLLVAFGRKGV